VQETQQDQASQKAVSLLPFQEQVVKKFFTTSNGKLLVGLPVGTGKTIITLKIIEHLFRENPDARVLIITPAGLRLNFVESRSKVPDVPPIVMCTSFSQLKSVINAGSIPVISYNFIVKLVNSSEFVALEWDLVIFDELHFTKNYQTLTSRACVLLASRSKMRLGLTASYIANKLEEFATMLYIITLDEFAKTLTSIEKIRIYSFFIKKYTFIVKEEEVNIHIRRPSLQFTRVPCVLSEQENIAYKYVEGKLNPMTLLKMKLLQFTDFKRVLNWVIAAQQVLLFPAYIIKSEPDSPNKPTGIFPEVGIKVIECARHILENEAAKHMVFTPYVTFGVNVIENFFSHHGIRCLKYVGGTSLEERQEIISKFTDPDSGYNAIILSLAGKEGINLPNTDFIHCLGYHWNPEVMAQVFGRARRMTSTKPVVEVRLYEAIKPHSKLKALFMGFFSKMKFLASIITIDGMMLQALKRKSILKAVVVETIHKS